MNKHRRQFLHALGGAGMVCAGFGAAVQSTHAQKAQQPATAPALAITELRDGLVQLSGAGGNVVLLPGSDGLLLVDSGSAERAQDLKRLIADEFAAAPVQALFNTHWHLEHTGGNDVLTGGGATVVAHENTRLWMSTKFYVDWQDRRYLPRPPEAQPNKTFFSSDRQPLTLRFGAEEVVYGHLLEAHTDGDIYVWFPERNVIVAGGTVSAGQYPVMDYITGGWIGGLMDATQTLIKMSDANTLIVPDMGPPQRRADLEAQHHMLATVRGRIEEMALKGQGIDEMIAAKLTKEFDARYGSDTDLFIANIYQGLWWNRLRAI